MKQRKFKKKVNALLLTTVMTITAFTQFSTPVHASELPDDTQFATIDDLKKFNTDDTDGETKAAKVYFGKNKQQWWIAGNQGGDSITLFAAKRLLFNAIFEVDYINNKQYDINWNCTYPEDIMITEVYPNHYGSSKIRKKLKDMETDDSYFSKTEQKLMNETTIYTVDSLNNSVYSTRDKLYLANAEKTRDEYITVGANSLEKLNEGLRVDNAYWESKRDIWLRTPNMATNYDSYNGALTTWQSKGYVDHGLVNNIHDLTPAFELNLSSVIFASAVPAVSSEGELTLQIVDGSGAFTLRYQTENVLGTAIVSKLKQSIAVTDVVNENTYLVVQNKDGAWAKKVSNSDIVFANEMSNTLADFDNCKIWLEMTADNITYATEITQQGNGYNIKVNTDQNMSVTSNNAVQSNLIGAISNITVIADSGYYFPPDYTVPSSNGISVTRDSNTQLTILGTPTSDVIITLPAATEKADSTISFKGDFKLDKTYDGKATSLSPNDYTVTEGAGNIVFSYQAKDGNDWKDIDTAPTNVGTYRVKAIVAENDSYKGTETDWKEFTISKATPMYNVPSGLIATVGQTLADVKLPDDFTWQDALTTSVGNVGINTFKVTYTPTDTVNYNTVTDIEITLTVNPKIEEPNELPIINASDKTLPIGDTFNPLDGVTASDKEDGDLTNVIEVLENTVDTTKTGTYIVTYKVTDSKGASSTRTITVTVKEKDTPLIPDKPDEPSKPEKGNNAQIGVQTGDATNLFLWGITAVLSAFGILLITEKKLKENRD